jgi:hypothetical protein
MPLLYGKAHGLNPKCWTRLKRDDREKHFSLFVQTKNESLENFFSGTNVKNPFYIFTEAPDK